MTIVYKSLIAEFIFKNQNLKLLPILIYIKNLQIHVIIDMINLIQKYNK